MIRLVLITLFAYLCVFVAACHARTVAIIGAGAGGASTAFFLNQLAQQAKASIDITIFEKENHVGGRVHSMSSSSGINVDLEVGGSIFLDSNLYMASLSALTNHTGVTPPHMGRKLGLWDETQQRFTFQQSGWKLLDKVRALIRYGPLTLPKLNGKIRPTVDAWNTAYSIQNSGKTFRTVKEFLDELSLYDLSQTSFVDLWSDDRSVAESLLVNELMFGVTRANYNQDIAKLNGFVSLISMATFAYGSSVLQVKGGNSQVFEDVIRGSGAHLSLNTAVKSIQKTEDGRFLVTSSSNGVESDQTFDSVVIATPLHAAGIQVQGVDVTKFFHPYQKTFTTVVKGVFNPAFFGKHESTASLFGFGMPDSMLSVRAADLSPFSSISTYKIYPNGTRIVKLFSPKKPTDDLLDQLFASREATYFYEWDAYPRYEGAARLQPTTLLEGASSNIYYLNSIENIASAIEVSLLWGRNIAGLVAEDFDIPRELEFPPPSSDALKREL